LQIVVVDQQDNPASALIHAKSNWHTCTTTYRRPRTSLAEIVAFAANVIIP